MTLGRILLAAMLMAGCVWLVGAAGSNAQAGPALTITQEAGSASVVVEGLDPDARFNGFDVTLSFDAALAEASGTGERLLKVSVPGGDDGGLDLAVVAAVAVVVLILGGATAMQFLRRSRQGARF